MEYKGVIRHLTTDGRPAADVRTGYVPQQLEFGPFLPGDGYGFHGRVAFQKAGLPRREQKDARKVMARAGERTARGSESARWARFPAANCSVCCWHWR